MASQSLDGILLIIPAIPGISSIKRAESASVAVPVMKRPSQPLDHNLDLIRQSGFPTPVEPEFQGQSSFVGQWHKVAGKIKFLKTITAFEVTKAVLKPSRIREVRNSFLCTSFDRFRQGGVCWRLIALGHF